MPIGRVGQGPGEYLENLRGIFLDEEQSTIIVCDYHKVITYDLSSGKYIKATPYNPAESVLLLCLAYFRNQFLFGLPSGADNHASAVYEIRNSGMHTIKQGVRPVPVDAINRPDGAKVFLRFADIICYSYEGQPCIKENTLNDTLYRVDKANNFIPAYVLDAGSYTITPEIRSDSKRSLSNYAGINSIIETKEYLLVDYAYKDKKYFCAYNKNNRTLFHLDSHTGIPNDYDGGLDFWPAKQKNNEWFIFYNTATLLEKQHPPTGLPLKGGKAAIQALKNLSGNLDADDNPVLVIAKIKHSLSQEYPSKL
jgi:hypothetical protein